MTATHHLTRDGALATITIDNQAKRNALPVDLRARIVEDLAKLMIDGTCRAIILTGAGGHFCAGGDVSSFRDNIPDRELLALQALFREEPRIIRLISEGPKPVIACVEGVAAGMGMSLALCSDYVVAARTARFTPAFARVGLLADLGLMWSLSNRVGPARAKHIINLSPTIDGEEAARLGIADEVADDPMAAAIAVAKRFADMPPLATAMTKTAFARGISTLESAIASEVELQPHLSRSQDHLQAVAAFVEKRKPVYDGH